MPPARPEGLPDWAFELLRCPLTGEALRAAEAKLVASLQSRQRCGELLNQLGIACDEELSDGLVNQSGTYFYTISDSIVNLVPANAIPLASQ